MFKTNFSLNNVISLITICFLLINCNTGESKIAKINRLSTSANLLISDYKFEDAKILIDSLKILDTELSNLKALEDSIIEKKKFIVKVKNKTILVAKHNFPTAMNFYDAKAACASLGDGWRLPNRYELNILYKNRERIGGFTDGDYWSSEESNQLQSWEQDFLNNGAQISSGKEFAGCFVRAVRDF